MYQLHNSVPVVCMGKARTKNEKLYNKTSKRTGSGYPIGHGWYSLEEAQYYAEDSIIAWMPLPEPYKED